jgi:hypothetical protein
MASRNRGRPKPKLRDLSRAKLTLEEQRSISDAFIDAPPISAAILGAVMVEHELDACLRRKFPKISDDDWSEMLEDNGPLRSFHAKIVMGHALHIYGEATRDNLHIVRLIRNAFAHSKKLIGFDHELIGAELSKIKKSRIRKRAYADLTGLTMTPATKFVVLCYAVAQELLRNQHNAIKAKNSRLRKKTSVPFLSLLGRPLLGDSGLSPLSSLQNQSAGPDPGAPGGLLDGLKHLFQDEPRDKQGK